MDAWLDELADEVFDDDDMRRISLVGWSLGASDARELAREAFASQPSAGP